MIEETGEVEGIESAHGFMVFAIGAAKAPDVPAMTMFAHECVSILDNEMDIHDGYMGVLNIQQEELDTMPMAI